MHRSCNRAESYSGDFVSWLLAPESLYVPFPAWMRLQVIKQACFCEVERLVSSTTEYPQSKAGSQDQHSSMSMSFLYQLISLRLLSLFPLQRSCRLFSGHARSSIRRLFLQSCLKRIGNMSMPESAATWLQYEPMVTTTHPYLLLTSCSAQSLHLFQTR